MVVGSQLSSVPKGLPLLPGNGFKDPSPASFAKKHYFDMKGGIACEAAWKRGEAPPPPEPTSTASSFPARDTASAGGAKAMPAWVAFDRKVLRFNCYFKESVVESRLENYRVRNCTLYYYLEDDSMHISEPKVENSGIPQGERKGTVFLKRHRVPKADGSYYTATDLAVGAELDLYGRVFKLTDADNFTRSFYEKLGITMEARHPSVIVPSFPISIPHRLDRVSPLGYVSAQAGTPAPEDPYSLTRDDMKSHILRNQKYFHPRPADDDLIRNMEARLGCSSTVLEPDKLDQVTRAPCSADMSPCSAGMSPCSDAEAAVPTLGCSADSRLQCSPRAQTRDGSPRVPRPFAVP